MNSMVERVARVSSRFLVCFAGLLLFVCPAVAQEFRGSIAGQLTDPAGAAVPGAQLTITNTATNTSTSTTTNEEGSYTVPYLTPGQYTISAEATGFKRFVRQGVEVRVGDKLTLDFAMETGGVQETVNVTGESTPLLDTNSATAGQVIDRRRISELPLSDGNPFTLTRLTPGVAYTGDLLFSRPFDNGGTSSIVADGATGGNEFTLDGIPNQASGRRVAFVPPADAVQEFKVTTANFDAQQGHTAGANVDVTLRSGANQFFGTIYEYVRNDVLSANDFFVNRTASAGRDEDGRARRPALRYNRYGATIGGPVLLPRFGEGGPGVISGRDRTFFFFSYEGLKDVFPEPNQYTVPTLAQRNGDFSALLPLGIRIYDPQTAVLRADGRVERQPFPNNIIPQNRISAIARNYLNFYPLPNAPGDAQGRNNFVSANPRSDDFDSEAVRIDHNVSEKQRFFVRYSRNNRRELRGNYTGEVNGILPIGNYLFRINHGVSYDHVYTASPTTILNFRGGFTRFEEPTLRVNQGLFNPASLGFSPQTVSFFGDALYFPRFEIGQFSVLGDSFSGSTTFNIYSLQPTVTKINGNHTFRFGYDFRSYRENGIPSQHAAGRYDFGTNFTRQLDNSAAAPIGQELAAFLLGQPTGGLIDRNAFRSNQTLYQGLFFQDDWRVSDKLSLNLGLRYEYEGGTTERYNRNIRGFDPTVTSPIEAAARAAYIANPIPQVAPADFRVRGGLLFATDANRGFQKADRNNFQPRLGFAYQLNETTVVRGGFAVYTVPFIINGVQQHGFSQSTNIVPSADNGLTFQATLFNPFPFGVDEPPGAALGLATFIGRGFTVNTFDRKNAQTQRYELGMQRELPGRVVVEAAYVGSYNYDVSVDTNLNPIPRQYLSTSPVRDDVTNNFLTANVTNPLRGLAPGTGFNNATIGRQQLLRPFPQFGDIITQRFDGSSVYHSGQFRVERRFAQGYTVLTSYTFSKLIEKVSLLNPTDAELEKRISRDDIPHRFVLSGIYELPFGRGRRFGKDIGRLANLLLGGYQLNGIYQYQSGRPLDFFRDNNFANNNYAYFGDPSQLRADIGSSTAGPNDRVFDVTNFYVGGVINPSAQNFRLVNNIRTFPSRLSGLRSQALSLADLSIMKNLEFTERVRLQLRGEFINAFNTPIFNEPNLDPTTTSFGRITSQANLPRNVQLGIKLIF